MGAWWLQVPALLSLPLIPLILARGFRADRVFFCLYVGLMAGAATASSLCNEPKGFVWRLYLVICGLPVVNFFLYLQARGAAGRICGLLLPLPLIATPLFLIGFPPEVTGGEVIFPQPSWTPWALLCFAGSVASLSLCWERWARASARQILSGIYRFGLVFWWAIFLLTLSRPMFTWERLQVGIVDALLGVHLLWILGAYPLVFRGGFLEVRARPSARLVGGATYTLAVMGIVGLFLWSEVMRTTLGMSWETIGLILFVLLGITLTLPLAPVGPLAEVRGFLQQHLYLPERDFAQEVALYLQVLGRKQPLERILDHLEEFLGSKAVALYREDRAGRLRLQARSSPISELPEEVDLPTAEDPTEPKKWIPLLADGERMGYLLVVGTTGPLSWERDRLLGFWSATFGILLRELEWKEAEEERQKLTLYSQATSFLLHDAKNLAQLLDLLLRNYHRLDPSQRRAFLESSLPALEQARQRARRMLEKLEAFHPSLLLTQQDVEIRSLLEGWARESRASFPELALDLRLDVERAPWVGDPQALCRALDNLLMNAAQATAGKGPVEIWLLGKGDGYLIEVRDQGPGVPEQERPRLFEPFFTTKPGGTGLGLYQSRVLVQRMGGQVGFRPNEPRGSVFYVRLDSGAHRRG